jgi:hypothetical protein
VGYKIFCKQGKKFLLSSRKAPQQSGTCKSHNMRSRFLSKQINIKTYVYKQVDEQKGILAVSHINHLFFQPRNLLYWPKRSYHMP